MEGVTKINACAFFVKDEEGQIREAGIVAFKRLHSSIKIDINVFKDEAREKMVRTCPPGGSAITSVIDVLREMFDVPIIDVPKTKTIAIRPNPAKS